jgi:RNA polymerase sigma-70 factor (ECF subfamily)
MRKKGPRYPVGEYLENALEEKDMHPEKTQAFREFQRIIHTAIGLLPPQQKQVYHLSREEGLSHDEIAQRMNLSKNTVRNHIVAALNSIRQYIRMHAEVIFLLIAAFLFR